MMKEFLQSKFMVLCVGASILMAYPILVFPKGELELLINKYHSPALDFLFKYITHLGDGSLLVILLVAVLFYRYHAAILVVFSIIFQALIISIFKRGIYSGLERPVAFFDEGIALNFVDGVDVHSMNTFPSGHTATGFAVFALLYILINKRDILSAALLFLPAALVGVSRVYLLQHFAVDAFFGALFGVLSVVLAMYLMRLLFSDEKLNALRNRSLRTFFANRLKINKG